MNNNAKLKVFKEEFFNENITKTFECKRKRRAQNQSNKWKRFLS